MCCIDTDDTNAREHKAPDSAKGIARRIEQLLDDELKRRYVGAKYLSLVDIYGEDRDTSRELVREGIRVTAANAGCGVGEIIEKITAVCVADDQLRMLSYEMQNQRDNEVFDRALARFENIEDQSDEMKMEGMKRLARVMCAMIRRDCASFGKDDWAMTTTIAAGSLLNCCEEMILEAPDAIRLMLSNNQAYIVNSLLENLGSRAIPVVDIAMERLANCDTDQNFNLSKGIAEVIRGSETHIRKVAEQVSDANPMKRRAAMDVLRYVGPDAANAVPGLVDQLFDEVRAVDRTPKENWRESAVFELDAALAAIARGRSDVADWFLSQTYSEDEGIVGEAITYIGELRTDADKCVPRLMELIDSYEEYDSDWCYGSEHSRILTAIECFGADAAMVAPELIERFVRTDIDPEEDDYNSEAVRALGSMGPVVAAEVLPVLEKLASRDPYFEYDDEFDELAKAIRKIKGTDTGATS